MTTRHSTARAPANGRPTVHKRAFIPLPGDLPAARNALLVSTALGCSIAISVATPGKALAANECGVGTPVGGVTQVTCSAASYPSGITYVNSGSILQVTVTPSVSEVDGFGISLTNDEAAALYNNAYVRLYNVTGTHAGLYVNATSGDAYILNHADTFVKGFGAGSIDTGLEAISGYGATIRNYGAVYATGRNQAIGINATAQGQSAKVYQTGDIVAGKAYGALHYAPNAAVGVVVDSDFAGAYADISGNVSVTGYDSATGVHAVSAIFGSHITVDGEINVTATTGAASGVVTGIDMSSSGLGQALLYGDLNVHTYDGVDSSSAGPSYGVRSRTINTGTVEVYGNLSAIAGGNTSGLHIFSYYYGANGRVSGDLSVVSKSGTAIGAYAHSGGEFFNYSGGRQGGSANLTVGGQIDVTGQAGATGLEAYSYASAANVTAGSVNVHAQTGAAIGAEAQGYSSAYVHVNGPVYARAYNGTATGIYASATRQFDTATAYAAGDVTAHGSGYSVGVSAHASDAVTITLLGNVTAASDGGQATGLHEALAAGGDVNYLLVTGNVFAQGHTGAYGVYAYGGNVSVRVDGNVTAHTDTGLAEGVYAYGSQANVDVLGNVSASSAGTAYGVVAVGNLGANVRVGGDAGAYAMNGSAYGLSVFSRSGSATAYAGSVHAQSVGGEAYGAFVDSNKNVSTTIYHDAVATAETTATGVFSSGGNGYNNSVSVGGNVLVTGYDNSSGIAAINGDISVTVGGDVNVSTYRFGASGIYTRNQAGDTTTIIVGGNITIFDEINYASGIRVTGNGTQNVTVDGNIVVTSEYSTAQGILIHGDGATTSNLDVHGSVRATGYAQTYGVYVSGGDVTVHVDGNVDAHTYSGLAEGVAVHGDSYTYIGGSVNVSTQDGIGTGVSSTELGGPLNPNSVIVEGNVHASGTQGATGIDAEGGTIQIAVGGLTYASSVAGPVTGLKANGYSATIDTGGGVYATTMFGAATGVDVKSYGQSVDVYVGKGLTAKTTTGDATGLSVIAASGTTSVHVGGDVDASTNLGNATGIRVQSDAYTYVGGSVNVSGLGGTAMGIYSHEAGGLLAENAVVVKGDVNATGTYGATGIDAEGGAIQITVGGATIASTGGGDAFGLKASGYSANITTTGGVQAFSTANDATAIYSHTTGDSLIESGGLFASSLSGNAVGLNAHSSSGNVIVGLGYASVQSVDGDATGVDATAQKSVVVYDTGTIFVFTRYGAATGAYVHGTQGNVGLSAEEIYARSLNGAATGVHSVASVGYDNDVTSTHYVRVQAEGAATGVYAYGGNIEVGVGTNVTVTSSLGDATGVKAHSAGSVYVGVGGEVTATAFDGHAEGVLASATGGGDAIVYVGGGVTAEGEIATGVQAYSAGGEAQVVVGGDVYAKASAGSSEGVFAIGTAGGDASATVEGNVRALGEYAVGVRTTSSGGGDASVFVGGDVYARSSGSSDKAFGVQSQGHDVDVTVLGQSEAKALKSAYGVSVTATGAANVETSGAYTESFGADATGVKIIGAGSAYLLNSGGSITAEGEFDATAVNIVSSGPAEAVIYGNLSAEGFLGTPPDSTCPVHRSWPMCTAASSLSVWPAPTA